MKLIYRSKFRSLPFFLLLLFIGLFAYDRSVAKDVSDNGKLETKTQNLRGYVIFGHEVATFRACGGREVFWVEGTDKIINILTVNSLALADYRTMPYQEIYVEIDGMDIGPAEDGFAADYETVIYVTTIKTLSWAKPMDCS
ncbi:MAG: hypothetical protein OIF58_09385 [Cohaesibacter sp.]|nr:hypothetical protein [Cohaesibacter sp.]